MSVEKINPKNQPATQGDLDVWGGELTRRLDGIEKQMITKDDLRDELSAYATKADLKEFKDEIIFEFKAIAEYIHTDVARANVVEVSLLKDHYENLDGRVTVLEKQR